MDLKDILNLKDLKATEKRALIVAGIKNGAFTVATFSSVCDDLNEKQLAVILEAMEEFSREEPTQTTAEWLCFAERFLSSTSNGVLREASRIVGNVAHLYEHDLEGAIEKLLKNTEKESTVLRWASAYALSKIVVIPKYAKSPLYVTIGEICESEEENGVKNNYVKALKKAAKIRG